MEIWKDIKGYEGIYQVSTLGRVKSLRRLILSNNGRSYWKDEKILKNSFDGMYYQVSLWNNRKYQRARIHRLVAEAFLPNPENYKCVNHKDLNKLNNNVDNLEWCTHLYNMLDALEKGAFDKRMQPVRVIETGKSYKSIQECAKLLNLEPKTISACLCGKRRAYKGYHFERVIVED